MANNQTDNKLMENGVLQILKYKPFNNYPITEICNHEEDGYIYDETSRKITLRCIKCGIHYEQNK